MARVLYGLKNCDTCRKAMKAIGEMSIDLDFQDVRTDGVPKDVLMRALNEFGREKVLNSRSTTWRGLSDAEKQDAPLALLKKYPALMKRPLIISGAHLSVGWNADIKQELEESILAD